MSSYAKCQGELQPCSVIRRHECAVQFPIPCQCVVCGKAFGSYLFAEVLCGKCIKEARVLGGKGIK